MWSSNGTIIRLGFVVMAFQRLEYMA